MGLEEHRVVRTAAPLASGGNRYRLGSGYLIADGLVLTAAHALEPAEGVPAQTGQQAKAQAIGGSWRPATVAWVDDNRDVAVLSCPELVAGADVRWGRLTGPDLVDWGAVGFPVASADDQAGRQAEHAFGRTSPISERAAGKLALSLESREPTGGNLGAADDSSPWAGLSGAAVFCGDYLVGVITTDPGRFVKSLEGRRVEDFCHDPRFAELLGHPAVLEDIRALKARRLHDLLPGRLGVRRHELEARFRAALQGQSRPLTLWGEGGNGKTHMARNIAADLRDETAVDLPVAVIRRGNSNRTDEPTYQSDLIACLWSVGQAAQAWSQAAQEFELRRLLEGPRCFAALLLDDVDSETIIRLIPGECTSPTIITSRARPRAGWPEIRIDAYEDPEALDAIRRILDGSNDEKLSGLCRILGNRPVAIDISARMIKAGHIDIDGLISALTDDTPGTLESAYELIGEKVETSIVRLYTEIHGRLETRPAAAAIVDVLLWVTSGTVEQFVVDGLLAKSLQTEAHRLAHSAAITWLANIGLIRMDQSSIEINGLSRTLLRWLRHKAIGQVGASFLETLLDADNPFRPAYPPVEPWYKSLEQANEEAAGLLQALGATFRVASNMFTRILGTNDLSIFCGGPREWLIRENNLDLFFDKSAGDQYGIVEVRDEAMIFWATSGSPQRLTRKQAFFMAHAGSLYTASVDSDMYHVLPDGSRPEDNSPFPLVRLEWFPWFEREDDGAQYAHLRIDPRPHDVIIESDLLSRSLCGRLFIRNVDNFSRDICPDCKKTRGSRETLTALWKLVNAVLAIVDLPSPPEPRKIAYWLAVRGRLQQLIGDTCDRAQAEVDYLRAAASYLDAFSSITDATDGETAWQVELAYGIFGQLIQLPSSVVGLRAAPICRWLIESMAPFGMSSLPVIYRCSLLLGSKGYYEEALGGFERCIALLQEDPSANSKIDFEKVVQARNLASQQLSKRVFPLQTSGSEVRMSIGGVRLEENGSQQVYIYLQETGGDCRRIMFSATPSLAIVVAFALKHQGYAISNDTYMAPFDVTADLMRMAGVALETVTVAQHSTGKLAARLSFSNGRVIMANPAEAITLAAWAGASLLIDADLLGNCEALNSTGYRDNIVADGPARVPSVCTAASADWIVPPVEAMLSVNIIGVQVHGPTNRTVILLKDRKGRNLPIWASAGEAEAVAAWQQQQPSTGHSVAHDMLCRVLTAADLRLIKVSIVRDSHGVFASELSFACGLKTWARPGDSIALAQRTGANIRVSAEYFHPAENQLA